MSLWFCSDCKIPFGPQPHCPRCGKCGVWQSGSSVAEPMRLLERNAAYERLENQRIEIEELRAALRKIMAIAYVCGSWNEVADIAGDALGPEERDQAP